MKRAVILTGGGIQGATAAATLAAEHQLVLVHVDYGQPAAATEFNAVEKLAASFPDAQAVSLSLPHIKQLRDGVGNNTKPVDTHEPLTPAALAGLIPVLLTVGAQCCSRRGAATLVTGLSRGCSAMHLGLFATEGRPENLPEVLRALETMLESLSTAKVSFHVESPLEELKPEQIITLAMRLSVPLAHTWSCQAPGPRICKRCDGCRARAAAFVEAGLVDPLAAAEPVSV